MTLDANDTLYITDRFGSAVHFLRVPFDKASGTWLFSSTANWANSPSVMLNGVPTAMVPQDVAINCDSGFPCTIQQDTTAFAGNKTPGQSPTLNEPAT